MPNYLTGIRLNGSLKIAPAFTADGRLRIAKANLNLAENARIAVAACLFPYTAYANNNQTFTGSDLYGDPNGLPIDPSARSRSRPGPVLRFRPPSVAGP